MPTLINDKFASIIPGNHILYEINYVIEYCKENNCIIQLDFNGTCHWISQFTDALKLSKEWYNAPELTKEEFKSQLRDSKLTEILK